MKFIPTSSITTASTAVYFITTRYLIVTSSAFGCSSSAVANTPYSTNKRRGGSSSSRFGSASLLLTSPFSTSVSTVLNAIAAGNKKKDDGDNSSSGTSKKPFPSWTFDKPCSSMEWSSLSHVSFEVTNTAIDSSSSSSSGSSDVSTLLLNDADLVIVGITAPSKDDDKVVENDEGDEDTDDAKENKDATPLVLPDGTLLKHIDDATDGIITAILTESIKTFKNGIKSGSLSSMVQTRGTGSTKRYALLGLGAPEKSESTDGSATPDRMTTTWTTGIGLTLGKALASHISSSSNNNIRTIHVALPNSITSNPIIVRDMVTSFYSELHVDNRYRTGARMKTIAEFVQTIKIFSDNVSSSSSSSVDAVVDNPITSAMAIEDGRKLAMGIMLTKDIVNAPHNVLNSESLAETAKRIAKDSSSNPGGGLLKCTILNKKECEARNMGAYLGVARGSETEPQFIHLTYTPPPGGGPIKKKIAVVGKGLLFDTGGYNIKTQMMELMKFDCGGAAAVLGAARAIGALHPPGVEVHFIIAACENMINDRAMVPSDILTASNGKTIEVLNTDAEGRLTLADALVYADKELGCESIIELSTLTGACMVALGKAVSGVWTDNDALATELADISKVTGDKSWRMPLEKEYNEGLESKIADLRNIGGKYGGSITAALFLQNFVNKKKPFAHIDIAGPVWSDKTGATGYGTKLIVEWVTRQGMSKE